MNGPHLEAAQDFLNFFSRVEAFHLAYPERCFRCLRVKSARVRLGILRALDMDPSLAVSHIITARQGQLLPINVIEMHEHLDDQGIARALKVAQSLPRVRQLN